MNINDLSEYKNILDNLPYSEPFLFVDELEHINEDGAKGNYTFREEADFYRGHFKDNPVTPGVILTECMAQIGVVSLGIFLLKDRFSTNLQIALTSNEIDFLKPVLPNETVTVISEKEYFRFNKLKCKVKMLNEANQIVCKGTITGMIVNPKGR